MLMADFPRVHTLHVKVQQFLKWLTLSKRYQGLCVNVTAQLTSPHGHVHTFPQSWCGWHEKCPLFLCKHQQQYTIVQLYFTSTSCFYSVKPICWVRTYILSSVIILYHIVKWITFCIHVDYNEGVWFDVCCLGLGNHWFKWLFDVGMYNTSVVKLHLCYFSLYGEELLNELSQNTHEMLSAVSVNSYPRVLNTPLNPHTSFPCE